MGRLDVAAGGDAGEGLGRAHLRARPGRVDFSDHPQHLQERPALELLGIERRRAGQQLVEDHAQGVDVGTGVDIHRRRVGLLRRHVSRSADDRAGVGEALLGELEFGRFGDAEVDDLRRGPAVDLGDQDVGGLQIAVDDPLLVGVLDRLADGHEQLQPGPHREPLLVAELGDRNALDQLHHKEGLAGRGGAAVVNAGDVGVIHQGQRLAFGVEAGQHRSRIHADLDQFQGHPPLDRLGLLGPVDRAHAPFSEDFEQRVSAGDDLVRDEPVAGAGRSGARDRGDRALRCVFPGLRFRRGSRFRCGRPGRFEGCG